VPSWDSREKAESLAAEIFKPVPHDEFARKVSDKRFTFYTSIASRIGMNTLASMVEYRIFHPNVGPESNDDFLYMRVLFDDIPFTVFAVPERFEEKVKELSEAILMRVAAGYPTVIGPTGITHFPGHKEAEQGRYNFFSIENTSGSLVYMNKPALDQKIRAREYELVNALMMYGYQVPLELIRNYLWLLDSEGQG
jgi:hypothetical protein